MVGGNKMKKENSREDKIFNGISYFILGLLLIVILYPLYFVVIASFCSPELVASGQITLIPKGINFDGYKRIFSYAAVWKGYFNTIYITVCGTVFNLFLTIPIAYVLTRKNFMARGLFIKILMFTMFFGGGLIPTYLLVNQIGLFNKPYSLIFLGGLSVYNVLIVRTTIANSIPEEMFEAATIDGCDHFGYFFQFVLPLSKSIIAVMVLYYGVGHWNNFMNALIYLNNPDYYPLQLVLRNILIMGQHLAQNVETADEALALQREAELLKYGLIVVSSAPLLFIYPFVQKYFQKGIMIGSVKG
jgi:putative aldouronate transport system permease protein